MSRNATRGEPLPNSPIAGQDDIPAEVGVTELRRARAVVEVYYRAEPGETVDIQARIFDALTDVGRHGLDYRRDRLDRDDERDLGDVLLAVDLTEHVRFDAGSGS